MVCSALTLAACAGPHISPLAPPPYRAEIPAAYDRTWSALVKALARENLPLRAIARDSGVIASDDFVTPIGLWADCGTIGHARLEGEALVVFKLFAEAKLKASPVYPCPSIGRFEANLVDKVRDLVKE